MIEETEVIQEMWRRWVLCSLFGGLVLSAVAFFAGVYSVKSSASAACDPWEHKPMPFCEEMGSPVSGIAVPP